MIKTTSKQKHLLNCTFLDSLRARELDSVLKRPSKTPWWLFPWWLLSWFVCEAFGCTCTCMHEYLHMCIHIRLGWCICIDWICSCHDRRHQRSECTLFCSFPQKSPVNTASEPTNVHFFRTSCYCVLRRVTVCRSALQSLQSSKICTFMGPQISHCDCTIRTGSPLVGCSYPKKERKKRQR